MIKPKWSAGIGLVSLLLVLAGCNLGSNEPDQPETLSDTPPTQGDATTTPSDLVLTLPTLTVAPTLTFEGAPTVAGLAPSSTTPLEESLPTRTPLPTLTDTPFGFSSGSATLTHTPFGQITQTNTPMGIITATPPPAVTAAYAPPPTFTPVIVAQTPVTPPPASAQVCATCGGLRLRESPGTAGNIITELAANIPLTIIGRTEDNTWAQVVTAESDHGWVSTEYLVIHVDLNMVSVTGTAVNAPTAVVATGPGGIEVVSGVTSYARQIFLDGLAKGNLPHSFAKVGDSITAAPQYLTPFGSGNYNLGEYGYLGGAIRFFSGPNGRGANPFSASSIAANNGWGTTSALDPDNADPNVCAAGETPLECEYRLVRPSVALIMFGTNDSGGLPAETFRANLQAIVQISINMGVIPVLSTIPPKHYNPATDGRVAQFNQIIVETARAYDVPLWNYWLAMRNTPGEGLAPDGVHPNSPPDGLNANFNGDHLNYGYPVRNLGALQVLYALWQQVLYDADSISVPPPVGTVVVGPPVGDPVDIGTYSCPGALPPRLTVGGQGRITPGLPNKVRSTPSLSGAQIGSIPGEDVFSVIGGPVCGDGFTWWKVNYNSVIGWTASGNGQEYWVEPYP